MYLYSMTKEEIEDILLAISDKEHDECAAVSAFTILYRGYSKFLNSVVSRGLKDRGIYDEEILNTVLNNTFLIIYEKPLIFSFSAIAENDLSFKAWLSTVAKNELKRLLEEYYKDSHPLEIVVSDPAIEEIELDEEIFESANLKTLNEALLLLSERDRHILRTIYLYHEEGKNTPSYVLRNLCEMFDTTTANIRKIKERSEKKIAEYVSSKLQLKPLKNAK